MKFFKKRSSSFNKWRQRSSETLESSVGSVLPLRDQFDIIVPIKEPRSSSSIAYFTAVTKDDDSEVSSITADGPKRFDGEVPEVAESQGWCCCASSTTDIPGSSEESQLYHSTQGISGRTKASEDRFCCGQEEDAIEQEYEERREPRIDIRRKAYDGSPRSLFDDLMDEDNLKRRRSSSPTRKGWKGLRSRLRRGKKFSDMRLQHRVGVAE